MSLQVNTADQTAIGTYTWSLIFDYNNSGNKSEITRKIDYSRTTKVNSKTFLENKFHVAANYEYKGEQSAKLTLKSIGETSSKIQSTIHLEASNDLVVSSEKSQEIVETYSDSANYPVAGGSRLTLYQLCYHMDGVTCQTGVLASTNGNAPDPDVTVPVTFSCTKSILGFTDILDQLFNTHPGSQNTAEWSKIRQCITQNRDTTQENAFRALVTTLSSITPLSANTAEWTAIRGVCAQILHDWDTTDKTLLLKVLLSQFADTNPTHDNTAEWQAIRTTSTNILGGLKELWAQA
jgi:hypothetical protein